MVYGGHNLSQAIKPELQNHWKSLGDILINL